MDSPNSLCCSPVLSERHIGHAPPTHVRVGIHQQWQAGQSRRLRADGGVDVQGMLHLRLPTPGLLRLTVRRMQESQGQAPDTRPQSIHVESASPRTRPRAGKGPAVRLSRRRAGRMRKTPWPMRCPQHHSRPLADRTHRARRSRPGPQRPATHARPVQALPRQQDREDETFGLQQQTKPQLTHTGFGTKAKHSIEAKPTTPAAHVE